MKFKIIAWIAGASVLALLYIGHKIHVNRLEGQLADMNETVLAQEETIEVKNGLYESKIQELRNTRQLNKSLKKENQELFNRNEKYQRKVREYTKIIAEFESEAVSDTIEVTTTADSSFAKMTKSWGEAYLSGFAKMAKYHAFTTLNYFHNGISINYRFSTLTGEFLLDIKREPITILYTLSQDSSGNWVADVSLPNYMSVSDIDGKVVPYKQHWYDKLALIAGAGTSPSVAIGVGYGSWSLNRMWTSAGSQTVLLKSFRLSDLWK